MKSTSLLVLSSVLFCMATVAAETTPNTMEHNFSYGLGVQFGAQISQEMKQKGIQADPDIVTQAIHDVLVGGPLTVSADDMRAAFEAYQKKQMEERKLLAEKNQKASDEFLAKNKNVKGVTVTASGLQYKILKPGEGKSPAPTDTVVVNYKGTLLNGDEFDSSFKRGKPATFPVNGVIKGWQEALPLMKKGAQWEIYVPPTLAYGTKGAGAAIGPNATLIFDIELLDINPPTPKAK
jgi:FKBP-type peptidyl-prolyl cis-trans isomerase FklB